MNILITGASGFIGSHIIQKLYSFNEGTIYALTRNKQKFKQSNIVSIYADLNDPNFEAELPKQVDCIVHLAQSEAYREFPEKANEIFSINLNATQRLLNWGYRNRIKKFIFASSGNVYKQQNKLLTENDSCAPVGYYGASKFAAEQLVQSYQDYFEAYVLRIFGVYGAGQQKMTIPNIINKVRNGEEITLANNEGLYFTPLYIDDCVEMILKIILSEKNRRLSIYNIAGDESVSLTRVVDLIAEIENIKPKKLVVNTHPMYLMGDSSLFKKDFNYQPETDIKTGITITLNHE